MNQDANEIQKAIFTMLEKAALHRSCLSCEHFTEDTEGCARASGSRPPARVIVTSCSGYEERIPF